MSNRAEPNAFERQLSLSLCMCELAGFVCFVHLCYGSYTLHPEIAKGESEAAERKNHIRLSSFVNTSSMCNVYIILYMHVCVCVCLIMCEC